MINPKKIENRSPHVRAKIVFLTYPQNDVKKEDFLKKLKEYLGPDFNHAIVCEEKHKDGTPHLHAFVGLKKRMRLYFEDLDKLGGKHGDYVPARNEYHSVRYIMKTDNWVADGFDPESFCAARRNKRNPKRDIVATAVMEGKSTEELLKLTELRGYVMEKRKVIESFRTFLKQEELLQNLKKWFVPLVNPLSKPNDSKIACWLQKNIKKPRLMGAKQLWIYGSTCMGKSSLLRSLQKMLKVYVCENSCKFTDGYSDKFDLIVFDEFKGQRTIQFMNQFVDGSLMRLNQKGTSYIKHKNLPVIVVSNFSPSGAYRKVAEEDPMKMATLERRFLTIQVTEPISLYRDYDWDNLVFPEDECAQCEIIEETEIEDDLSVDSLIRHEGFVSAKQLIDSGEQVLHRGGTKKRKKKFVAAPIYGSEDFAEEFDSEEFLEFKKRKK